MLVSNIKVFCTPSANYIFWKVKSKTFYLFIYLFLPLHTGSCCPIYGRAPAPPQGYRRCAGAYPAPVYHSWRAHSEDRETLGIEPGTSRSPDERSTNWANRPANLFLFNLIYSAYLFICLRLEWLPSTRYTHFLGASYSVYQTLTCWFHHARTI